MTVAEFIAVLEKFPRDVLVVYEVGGDGSYPPSEHDFDPESFVFREYDNTVVMER